MLHDFIIEKYIKQALEEDISSGDITTDSVCDDDTFVKAVLNSRSAGVVCGINVFRMVFKILDPKITVKRLVKDGDKISAGQDLAIIEGHARGILTGERTALNFIQRMSAISTMANQYQEAIKPYKAQIVDTRKTTPNFRLFEKYAVKVGGGALHRFNLSDCVMLKDNHIKMVGSITEAVNKVRTQTSHAHKIEVEVDTMEQMQEALAIGADIIMLDNMDIEAMKKAVEIINGRAIVEASGNVSLETVKAVAATGVDIISTSAIQTKAGTLDIGLDI